jgi:hypothetical protein
MWFRPTPHLSKSRVARKSASVIRRSPLVESLEERRLMSAPPSVSVSDLTITEGNDGVRTALVTVSLSAASNKSIAVNFRTENGTATAGSDYQSANGSVTFVRGETRKAISIPVYGDRAVEPNETFFVRLLSTSWGKIGDNLGVVTILDDEPRISISDASTLEGCGCFGTTPLTFTVSMSAAYDQAVTVNYTTVDGTATVADGDYTGASGMLTFAPGETTKTITIAVLGDTVVETDELLFVDLGGSSLAGSIMKGRGAGWILDDDASPPPPPVDPGPDPTCTPDNPYYPHCDCTPDNVNYPNC